MLGYRDKIRQLAAALLGAGRVDMVIGFCKGALPLMNTPCVIRRPEDVDQLTWDSNCGINLANYLTRRKETVGIVAKGCDSRNIVTHIIENRIPRDRVVIIGVPCKGMVDRRKIEALTQFEIESAEEADDQIIVSGGGKRAAYRKAEVLQENCAICIYPNPVIYDELAAEAVQVPQGIDRYADVRQIEAMTEEARQRYFDDLIRDCIRCYACRNACPLCYCPTCFVDQSNPQWVGKSQDAVDVRTFHFLRAFHCAGRCTDCGACERACPLGIKVRKFTKKLEKDCLELFHWEAGLTLEKRPPLTTFSPDDPDEFIQ